MPTKHTILPLLLILVPMICACSGSKSRHINRLDITLADSTATLSPQQAEAADIWIEISGNGASLDDYRRCRPVKVFSPEIAQSLQPLDSVERVLGEALLALGDERSRLFGLVIPNTQSIITHPSGIVLIGLNHYLGSGHKIYGAFPEFIRRRKELSRLPVDVVEAVIARDYPATMPAKRSLLNEMLYRGALMLNVLDVLPEGTSEALVLGMTADEYDWCRKFDGRMWNTLIEKRLLYSTNDGEIRLLTNPAPHSRLINANAPGSAALFLGLQIARSYLENNPGSSARDLLDPSFYADNSSLVKSRYTPANAN